MSERISPRFSPGKGQAPRSVGTFRSGLVPLSAILLTSVYGCASSGSSFGSGGSTGTNSGGSVGSSGGSGVGSGGSTNQGSGGSDPIGSGGTTGSGGTGVDTGTGGGVATGSGGAVGSGGSTTASGGTTAGSGGSLAGTGGRVGSGGAIGSGGAVAGPACPKPAGQICHEFYANDNANNRILYVNEFDPTKNWTAPVGDTTANSPRTIEIVDNPKAVGGKAIMVSLEKGYGEFDIGNKGALLYRVNTRAGVSGACRLPDGNTALGIDLVNSVVIVNPAGAEVRRIPIPTGDNLRAINRKADTMTFWFSETNLLYEMNESGTIKWMGNMGAGTKGYAVWWTPSGGAYATTGEPSQVIELNAAGVVVPTTKIGGKTNFPGLGLDFFSGFVHMPNGNFIVANWLGHPTAILTSPHLVEFSPDNKLVWQWGSQAQARQITNLYVIR